MLVNLSNHPASRWGEDQIEASRAYGEIIDLKFPEVDPAWDEQELRQMLDTYYRRILAYGNPVVLLQGEHVFGYRLTKMLQAVGIKVVAAMSRRVSMEQEDSEGNTVKVSVFRFEGYREY